MEGVLKIQQVVIEWEMKLSEVVKTTKISYFLICSLNPNILTFVFKVKLLSVHSSCLP